MLVDRIKTALILLVPTLICLWVGELLLGILCAFIFLRINYELFSLSTQITERRRYELTAASALLPTGWFIYGPGGFFAAYVVAVMMILAAEVVRSEMDTHLERREQIMFTGMLGLSYTGSLGTVLIVTAVEQSFGVLLWFLLVVIATDTFSYFAGSSFGKHKLSPRISPNKTVEGAVCGILGAILTSFVAAYLIPLEFTFLECLAWSLLVSVFAIFGDLVESMIKRYFQVKDTAQILPGHGGLLDRLDALLFAAPLLFFISV